MSRVNHSFSVEHAEAYGIECAVMIHHLQFWIEQNQVVKRNFHDGRTWMYQTQKDIVAYYPYWNRDKVQSILQKLEDYEVIIKGNYNKSSIDRTAWYAFKNEEIFTKVRNRTMGDSKPKKEEKTEQVSEPPLCDSAHPLCDSAHPLCDSAHSIPDTKQRSYPDVFEVNESMTSSKSSKGKSLDASRKYRNSEEQHQSFIWLKEKNINTDDETLSWWARNYPQSRLCSVYKEAKKKSKKNLGGYMQMILKSNAIISNSITEQNLEFAKDYASANDWKNLKFYQKHIRINDWDLSLDIDPNEFANALMNKHQSIQSNLQRAC